jgi:hypothetical protein
MSDSKIRDVPQPRLLANRLFWDGVTVVPTQSASLNGSNEHLPEMRDIEWTGGGDPPIYPD